MVEERGGKKRMISFMSSSGKASPILGSANRQLDLRSGTQQDGMWGHELLAG